MDTQTQAQIAAFLFAAKQNGEQLTETQEAELQEFISNQEPLGAEFEAVLNDNIYELYET